MPCAKNEFSSIAESVKPAAVTVSRKIPFIATLIALCLFSAPFASSTSFAKIESEPVSAQPQTMYGGIYSSGPSDLQRGVSDGGSANQADADALANLLNNYWQAKADNPGFAQRELNDVRQKLISLQAKHVAVKFDVKLLTTDEQLDAKIRPLFTQKVAGPIQKALVHGALICFAWLASCHGGPGPDLLPEINHESSRRVEQGVH